jgi:hypothetical protein
MKRFMTALGLAAAISLFSVSPSALHQLRCNRLMRNGSREPAARSRIHDFLALPVPSHNETLVEER